MKDKTSLKTFSEYALRIGLWLLLYLSFVQENDGAMNVLLFYVWATFVMCFGLVTDDAAKRLAQEPAGSALQSAMHITWTIAAVVLMAWHGRFFSAFAVFITASVYSYAIDAASKLRAAAKEGFGGTA